MCFVKKSINNLIKLTTRVSCSITEQFLKYFSCKTEDMYTTIATACNSNLL